MMMIATSLVIEDDRKLNIIQYSFALLFFTRAFPLAQQD